MTKPVYYISLEDIKNKEFIRKPHTNFLTTFSRSIKQINRRFSALNDLLSSSSGFAITPAIDYIDSHGVFIFRSMLEPLFLSARAILRRNARFTIGLIKSTQHLSTASPKIFTFAAENLITRLGIDINAVCPPLTKMDVLESDNKTIPLYLKDYGSTLFGNNNSSNTKISVNLGIAIECAIEVIKLMVPMHLLKPRSLYDCIVEVLSKDASSGLPYRINKKTIDIDLFYKEFSEFLRNFKPSILASLGTVLAHRHQIKYDSTNDTTQLKVRIIFVVSLFNIALGTVLFSPLSLCFEQSSKHHKFASNYLTPMELSSRVNDLRNVAFTGNKANSRHNRKNKNRLLNVDFSKFDTSIMPYLKVIFFLVCFPFCAVQSPIFGGFQNFCFIYWTFAVCSTYQYIFRNGNIPELTNGSTLTGEYITSFFNTFVHLFVLSYYKRTVNPELNLTGPNPDIIVQGDDGLYTNSVCLRQLKELADKLGLNVSDSSLHFKYNSSYLFFLGRRFDKYSRPYQTRAWIIAHSIYPGRGFSDIPDTLLYTARNYSLANQLSNSNFVVKFLSQIDDRILADALAFKRNINHEVWVHDRLMSIFRIKFSELLRKDRFPKYDFTRTSFSYSP